MTKEEQISRVFPRLESTDIKHQKLCIVMQEYSDQQNKSLKRGNERREKEINTYLDRLQDSHDKNKDLLKEVESLMSTINKLSGGTLSGILEEEITNLKKQLEESKKENERLVEEIHKANRLMTTVLNPKRKPQ
jgi:predicted  nucleic acid-binding Zn-ribbon protein